MVIAILSILLSFISILLGILLTIKSVNFMVMGFTGVIFGFTFLLQDGLPLLAKEKQIQSTVSMQTEFQTELGNLEGKPIYYSDLEKYIEYFELPEITSFDAPIKIHLYTKDEIKKDITEREDDKLIIGKIYHVRE